MGAHVCPILAICHSSVRICSQIIVRIGSVGAQFGFPIFVNEYRISYNVKLYIVYNRESVGNFTTILPIPLYLLHSL